MSEYKNIWVLAEVENHQLKRNSLELMGKARELADEKSQTAVAVLIGNDTKSAEEELIAYGADQVICVNHQPTVENSAYILAHLSEVYHPAALLIGDSAAGREISAALSARLDAAMASDCTNIMYTGTGLNLFWIRVGYDGKVLTNIETKSMPQIGTFRPGTFELKSPVADRKGEILNAQVDIPLDVQLTQFLGFMEDASVAKGNIEEAQIIVAGGNGVGSKAGFEKLYELAAVMGGVVGASRAAVDEGWISKDCQVGATGKTVTPKIYIACGISGAVPHVAGMKDSDVIIAINTDPNASIFEIAHYCIVGDLHKVVPIMTEAIKKLKK